jgi:tetratricopeptide (TPR) repeat protein
VELGPYAYAFASLNLGLGQVKRGHTGMGLFHLRTAVCLWPTSPDTHLYLGYGLGRTGNIQEAEEEFCKGLRLRPNFMKAHRYLADFYERQGRWKDAVTTLGGLLALDPNQSTVQAESTGSRAMIPWLEAFRSASCSRKPSSFSKMKSGYSPAAI